MTSSALFLQLTLEGSISPASAASLLHRILDLAHISGLPEFDEFGAIPATDACWAVIPWPPARLASGGGRAMTVAVVLAVNPRARCAASSRPPYPFTVPSRRPPLATVVPIPAEPALHPARLLACGEDSPMIKLGIAIALAAAISGSSGFIAGRTTAYPPLYSRPRPYPGPAAMGCGGRCGSREPFV